MRLSNKKISISTVLIVSFILLFFAHGFAVAQIGLNTSGLKEDAGFKDKALAYLRVERAGVRKVDLDIKTFVMLLGVDVVLSLFCLWLTIFLLGGSPVFITKKYMGFLFGLNSCWFIMLIFLKGLWNTLDYFYIKLRPESKGVLLEHFTVLVIVIAVIIYIWLIARNFGFNFYGSCGVFALSHITYLGLVLFISFMLPFGSTAKGIVSSNLGLTVVARGYVVDIDKIVFTHNPLSLFRFRPFHL